MFADRALRSRPLLAVSYNGHMAPKSSTSRKIRRATVLAESGRFLSLADLAAAVRLSESTLRRYGVALPATTPADIPSIAAAAAAYAQPDATPAPPDGQDWHVEHIPADGMGRRQRGCLNKRNVIAEELASSLNTQRAAFVEGRGTSRKDESVHAVVSGPVDIGELRSMLPEGATVSVEPPGRRGDWHWDRAFRQSRRGGFALSAGDDPATDGQQTDGRVRVSCGHRRCRRLRCDTIFVAAGDASVSLTVSGTGRRRTVAAQISTRPAQTSEPAHSAVD